MSRTLDYRFSDKHKAYMKKALTSTINVAEGAVRAGKTVDNVFCFAYLLETSPDKLHLATGSTASNAMINIGDSNGYGLEHIFRGRCRYKKYRGSEALEIETRTGKKTVIFAGAAKADSYKKIRGNSYGMWIATEINLHHKSAITEAFNRQLAAKRRRVFWDLNPSDPRSFIYKEYIDRYAEMEKNGELGFGYNYGHFTIFDNATVSKARLSEIVSQYDRDSIWYRRDILGERCAAEGLIYPAYASHGDKFSVDLSDKNERSVYSSDIGFIEIGVDFGGNRSLTAFVATGIHKNFDKLTVLCEHEIDGNKGDIDPDRVNNELYFFIKKVTENYPNVPVKAVRADCAEQYLIAGMRKYMKSKGIYVPISDSIKRPIVDRIRFLNMLLSKNAFAVEKSCAEVDSGIRNARWDTSAAENGKDVRADDFTSNIDIMDALEYSFENHIDAFGSVTDVKRSGKAQIYAGDFKGGWS